MRKLLLSTSVIALALGMGMASASATDFGYYPPPAPAKDSVVTTVKENHEFSNKVTNDWSWTKDVYENVNIDIDIDITSYIPPITELTQIANVQKLFGSVNASTTINAYIAPSGGTTTTTTSGGSYATLSGEAPVGKDVPTGSGEFQQIDSHYANLDGIQVYIPSTTTTTTTLNTLPVVLGSATAIGNMFSLASSDPTLLLNSDQIQMPNDTYPVSVNANLTSTVTNAAVKLDSTAISNMLSIDMSAPSVVVGSIMQTSYADVSATANSTQTIGGGYDYSSFNGLSPENISGGVLVNPPDMTGVVASVNATAIGNMASINLGTYAKTPTGAGSGY
jgi:hypothetical protein